MKNRIICSLLLLACGISFAKNNTPEITTCPVLISSSYVIPTCKGLSDGKITFNLKNIEDGIYNNHFYFNENEVFNNVVVKGGIATISNLPEGTYNNIVVKINENSICDFEGLNFPLIRPKVFRPAQISDAVEMEFCPLKNPTVSDLPKPQNGKSIAWQLSPMGEILDNSTSLVNNAVYYSIESVGGTCDEYFYKKVKVMFKCQPSAQDDYLEYIIDNASQMSYNVFDNDNISGGKVNSDNVLLKVIENDAFGIISLKEDGTLVISTSKVVSGIYSLTYSICDKNKTDSCDSASVNIYFSNKESCPIVSNLTLVNPTCGNADGKIIIEIHGLKEGIYTKGFYYNEAATFSEVTVSKGKAIISGLVAGEYSNIRFVSENKNCHELINEDVVLVYKRGVQTSQPLVYPTQQVVGCLSDEAGLLNAWNYITDYQGKEVKWYLDFTRYSRVNEPILNELGTVTYYAHIVDINNVCDSSIIVPVELKLVSTVQNPVTKISCEDGLYSLAISSPLGQNFEYSLDGNHFQSSPLFYNVEVNNYEVIARNKIGCESRVEVGVGSFNVIDCKTLGINSEFLNPDIKVWPNPADNVVNISYNELINSDSLIIYNSLGQVVLQQTSSGLIDVNNLSSGTYIIQLVIGGEVISSRFVKR